MATNREKKSKLDKHGLRRLTPMEARFAQEYMLDLNGTQAAIRAGYSPKTANEQAPRLLVRPSIKAAIATAMAKRSEQTEVRAAQVVRELARIGFANIKDFAEWGPDGVTFKDSKDIPLESAASILEVRETPGKLGKSLSIKLHGKAEALKLLGQHIGMFVDRTEVSGPGGGPIPTADETPAKTISSIEGRSVEEIALMLCQGHVIDPSDYGRFSADDLARIHRLAFGACAAPA